MKLKIFILVFFLVVIAGLSVLTFYKIQNNTSDIEYSMSLKKDPVDFLDYISSKETLKVESGTYFFKVLDEKDMVFTKIHKISDDEYMILGYRNGENHIYFIEKSGEIINKFFIESGNTRFYDFINYDDYILLVGEKDKKNYYLSVSSKTGEKLWSKTDNTAGRFNVVKKIQEGFVMAGYKVNEYKNQAYISEINIQGQIVWSDTSGREGNEEYSDLMIASDGYICIGNSDSNPEKLSKAIVARYSKDGIKIFEDEYGMSIYNVYPVSAFIDENYNLYFSGYVASDDQTTWRTFIAKTVSSLEVNGKLDFEFFETKAIQNLSRITEIKYINQNIYSIGFSVDKWPDYDGFIRIMGKNGTYISQGIYGTSTEERFYSFENTSDNSLIIVGYQKNDKNVVNPIIIKTDSKGLIPGYHKQ